MNGRRAEELHSAPATHIRRHSRPHAVTQLLTGIAVSYESRGELNGGLGKRPELETEERGDWSHVSCADTAHVSSAWN